MPVETPESTELGVDLHVQHAADIIMQATTCINFTGFICVLSWCLQGVIHCAVQALFPSDLFLAPYLRWTLFYRLICPLLRPGCR